MEKTNVQTKDRRAGKMVSGKNKGWQHPGNSTGNKRKESSKVDNETFDPEADLEGT